MSKTNNKWFGVNDKVSLQVDIKNIQNMNIKIFEIKTENYYLKNGSAFDNQIDLEGIIPSTEQNFKYE
jgi:hypothetical protein